MKPYSGLLSMTPYFVSKVWGGSRLKIYKRMTELNGPLGESWEISNLGAGPSSIDGVKLDELYPSTRDLSYLIKFIDTQENLSIQVHPGDDYARKYEQSSGKTECWIIIDAKPDSGVYIGLNEQTAKTDFEAQLRAGEDISGCLNFFPVKPGDFFHIPAGAIHAIGKDIVLLEVQQSSGITYRVFDWNRVGMNGRPRPLHIDKALENIVFGPDFNQLTNFFQRRGLFDFNGGVQLFKHPHFEVTFYRLKCGERLEIDLDETLTDSKRPNGLVCIDGKLKVTREFPLGSLPLSSFESLLVPWVKNSSKVIIEVERDTSFVWVS